MFWRVAAIGCVLAVAIGLTRPAYADITTVDVPATIPTATASSTATPATSGISTSDWSFQTAPLAGWLDGLAGQLFGVFSAILNRSIAMAQALFYALAVAEFGFALGRWAISNTPLEEVVASAYVKAVQLGLLYLIIGSTFTLPGGGPGWFPLIVGGIIGMAQDAAGVSVVSQFALSGSLTFANGFMPGDVFTFFWNIAVFVLKSAFTQETIGGLLVGAFTGATAIWIVTALMAAISALGILSLGCYVSFKYFLTLFKAYLVASQAYLQGFLGSTKTAANGSGLFNAALNVGIEMGALVIVVGVFKSFLSLALGAMSLGFLVASDASTFGSQLGVHVPTTVVQSATTEGVRLVAVLLIDALAMLWAYAVKTLPEWASSALSGRLEVRPEEAIAHAFASSAVVKAGSAAAAIAGGALGVKMLASGAAGGATPTFADRAGSAARGAVQGGLFAGVPGAVGGAVMGAASATGTATAPAAGEEARVSSPFVNREFAPKGRAGTGWAASGAAAGSTPGTQHNDEVPHGASDADASSGHEASEAGATGGDRGAPRAQDAQSSGGEIDSITLETGGIQQGTSRGSTQSGFDTNAMRDLTDALYDATAALRSHRFGGASGGASGGPTTPGGPSGSGASAGSGGLVDPIFGSGRPMNPLNLMLYRKLLGAGAPPAPRIAPDHPAASIDVATLVS